MNALLPNLRESQKRPGNEQARLQPVFTGSGVEVLAARAFVLEVAASESREK